MDSSPPLMGWILFSSGSPNCCLRAELAEAARSCGEGAKAPRKEKAGKNSLVVYLKEFSLQPEVAAARAAASRAGFSGLSSARLLSKLFASRVLRPTR